MSRLRIERVSGWLVLGLMAATLLLFWPAVGFDYLHLDDYPYVADNPMVAGGLTWAGIQQAFTTVHEEWWLPLLWISYMADISLFGAGPMGHHLVNILLHAVNAGLLFWVLLRLTGSRWKSLFVAALFAWHPTRVEAVAWIAARKDVLSGLFFMLCLWVYARGEGRLSPLRRMGLAGLMLAGLMSKAILIILPPILLLLDMWPLRRVRRFRGRGAWGEWKPCLVEKWPLIVLAGLFMAVNLWTHASGRGADEPSSLFERVAMLFPNIWVYVKQIVWPVRLNIIYPERYVVSWPAAAGAALAVLAVLFWAWKQGEKRPWNWMGVLWFLAGLFPILRGVRMGLAQYADRWTYLPIIGLGIAVAWTAGEWHAAGRGRRLRPVMCGLVLMGCGVLTREYLWQWKDSLTLMTRAVDLAPAASTAHFGLGRALFDAGRLEEAAVSLQESARLRRGNVEFTATWGAVLPLIGQSEKAKEVLRPFLPDTGKSAELIQGAYGMACLDLGEEQEAIVHLNRARTLGSNTPGFRVELIRAYFEAGEVEQARSEARQIQDWPGTRIQHMADLAPFYVQRWRDGARAYAWNYFRRLAAAQPESAALQNNAAWLAATDPEAPAEAVAEAVGLARRAVDLTGGGDAAILSTLSVAQAAAGDFKEAVKTGQRALALAKAQGDAVLAERMEARLCLFREGKPYRE